MIHMLQQRIDGQWQTVSFNHGFLPASYTILSAQQPETYRVKSTGKLITYRQHKELTNV